MAPSAESGFVVHCAPMSRSPKPSALMSPADATPTTEPKPEAPAGALRTRSGVSSGPRKKRP